MGMLLHIDTSGSPGVVMLANNGKVISSQKATSEREHAAHINRMLDQVLMTANIQFSDLDAVCVCNGPGSYTGLRIGLSTAKGLCFALSKPLITHSKLVLYLDSQSKYDQEYQKIIALLPARTDEYFIAGRGADFELAPCHIHKNDWNSLMEQNREDLVIIGTIPQEMQAELTEQNIPFIFIDQIDLSAWAQLTHTSFIASKFADLAYDEPKYLKEVHISTKKPKMQG
ncbi:MAG: tRNA (adenosine(37)-N6)-threonylcarbamoyltransferase complex dimerization subunit type 1 TsaB [Bacteroidetes bacterium]|nr:tRNA (adenosine(37)-N6)-threonylcarbamoyltransferase complex dimerization subunit type 1 TsaB [Bacteroidota bacterium]